MLTLRKGILPREGQMPATHYLHGMKTLMMQPPNEGAGMAPAPFAGGRDCAGPPVTHMTEANMQGT